MVECLLPPQSSSTLLNHCSWFFSTQPSVISIGVSHSQGEKQSSEFTRKKQDRSKVEEEKVFNRKTRSKVLITEKGRKSVGFIWLKGVSGVGDHLKWGQQYGLGASLKHQSVGVAPKPTKDCHVPRTYFHTKISSPCKVLPILQCSKSLPETEMT